MPATKRLIEQDHVPVIIGALCTPVTHAIQPVVQAAKVPLIIATSAGQDFVDASGIGGNDYLFKTIPSETDIAGGLIRYLKARNVKSIAIVAEAGGFPQANAVAMAKLAPQAGITVTAQETLTKDMTDLGPLLDKLKSGSPDALWVMPGASTAAFFKAYETSGWNVRSLAGSIPTQRSLPSRRDFAATAAWRA